MSARPDLVIRRGTVIDGTGGDPIDADVAVTDGVITEVGRVTATGREELDARGRLVMPGFVDIHTHYDAQAVWSGRLTPSSWHGVTTLVMGNCGVGFAPCRPGDRDELVSLMSGVEDIPEPVLTEGMDWQWETFPEYLSVVAGVDRDTDVAALLPHAALRVYVMGDRALRHADADAADIAAMRCLVADAVTAGALGVSTSRTSVHQNLRGERTPTFAALEAELTGLGLGLRDAGTGVLQLISEWTQPDPDAEFAMLRRVAAAAGRPCLFSLMDRRSEDGLFARLLDAAGRAVADGVTMRAVVAPRAIGFLLGLEASQHPFAGTATYRTIAHLPLADRVRAMRDPHVRARILAEDPAEFSTWPFLQRVHPSVMYPLGDPPDYEPDPHDSVAAVAARAGLRPAEVLYDLLLADDGNAFIYVAIANYRNGDLSIPEAMLADPNTIMGLGDGGAHVGFLVDAGFPTFLLEHWGRRRERFPVPELVRRLTSDPAHAMGLTDRGVLAPGRKADLNVIDWDTLGAGAPYVAHDLPAGGRRFLQRATGYTATVLSGQVTYRDGQPTDALPGRLVRGTRR